MEKKLTWLLTLILSMLAFVMTSCGDDEDLVTETYYMNGNEKVSITVMNNKAFVAFQPENEDTLRNELSKYDLTLSDVYKYTGSVNGYTYEGKQLFGYLMRGVINGNYKKAASALNLTVMWIPCYRMAEDGRELIPFMEFYVKLKPDTEVSQFEKLIEQNNVIISQVDDSLPNSYTLACTNESKGNPIEMANLFYSSSLFEYSVPDFIGLFILQ